MGVGFFRQPFRALCVCHVRDQPLVLKPTRSGRHGDLFSFVQTGELRFQLFGDHIAGVLLCHREVNMQDHVVDPERYKHIRSSVMFFQFCNVLIEKVSAAFAAQKSLALVAHMVNNSPIWRSFQMARP